MKDPNPRPSRSFSVRLLLAAAALLGLAACNDDEARLKAEAELQTQLSEEREAQARREAAELAYNEALIAQENVRMANEGRIEAIKEAGDQIAPVAGFAILALAAASLFRTLVGYKTAQNKHIMSTSETMLETATALFTADKINGVEYNKLVQAALTHQTKKQPLLQIGFQGG